MPTEPPTVRRFSVAAFRSFHVPDEQNAFAFLRRADKMMIRWPEVPRAVGLAAPTVPWSKADLRLRGWVDENRQAIEMFQQAAEQPDASIGDPSMDVRNISLSILALLEGSRRQESGDSPSAWECYRAVLRMAAHVGGRGTLDQRHCSDVILLARGWLQARLAAWAADPRTTIPQLHSVLDEVLKTLPKPDAGSFAVKSGYLEILRSFDRPMASRDQQEFEGEKIYRLGDMQVSTDLVKAIEEVRRFLLGEPERSRRAVRLLCANWLAHVETPTQRKPAVRAIHVGVKPRSLMLYAVGPGASAGARALPPHEVASWLVSTDDAKLRMLWEKPWKPDHQVYRKAHRELVVLLASELYLREHGSAPPTEEALVGSYLDSLPDDGSGELTDGTIPVVE